MEDLEAHPMKEDGMEDLLFAEGPHAEWAVPLEA